MRKVVRTKRLKNWYFFIPSILGVFVFSVLPFCDIVYRSFLQGGRGPWVGVKNYQMLFSNTAFHLAVSNTVKFLCICLPPLLFISLIIAVFLKKNTKIDKLLKALLLLPLAVPLATVAVVWYIMFAESGILNGLLSILGASTRNWMNSSLAFNVLVVTYCWKNIGYNVVLWIAGLSRIPNEIYEAAHMDGASKMLCFLKITLPNLRQTGFMLSVLSLINFFKVYREAYLVAGDYPHTSMYMLQHLFNNWFRDMAIDRLAAVAVMETIVIMFVIYGLHRFWREDSI